MEKFSSGELITILKEGYILSTNLYSDGDDKTFIYNIKSNVVIKGWGSALYKSEEMLFDIFKHPENFEVLSLKITDEMQHWPWSIHYDGKELKTLNKNQLEFLKKLTLI